MKYVCEPFSNQISDLETERKTLQQQLDLAAPQEKAAIMRRIEEIDLELPGLQQSLADCQAKPEHFKEEPADPRDPHKR